MPDSASHSASPASLGIPNTHRFFVSPELLEQEQVTLTERRLVHQIGRVLRLRVGDRILLLDGRGTSYQVRLTEIGQGSISGVVEHREAVEGESSIALALYPAVLRPERFDWVLQKGTELGVAQFVPVWFSRCVVSGPTSRQKLERWRRIVREAAEQSWRGVVPEVAEPQPLEQAYRMASHSTLPLILWEGDGSTAQETPLLRQAIQLRRSDIVQGISCRSVSRPLLVLFSGPEGGITTAELASATAHGIIPVSLGKRILRAETAPIVAAAALFYEFDW